FRTGFAKTTQLLATELFDLQRLTGDPEQARLVSFSDSRQDAARASLEVERQHHNDVRRQLVVATLREVQRNRPSREANTGQTAEVNKQIGVESGKGNVLAITNELAPGLQGWQEQLKGWGEPTVALADVTETLPGEFRGPAAKRRPLLPLLRRFVELG